MVFFIFIQTLIKHSVSSGDPDQTLHCGVSDLGLHCLSMSHKKYAVHIWVSGVSAQCMNILIL